MYYKIRNDVLFRKYQGHGYIADNSEYGYRMYVYQRLGKFGRDFSSYQGFLSLTESANYSKTMDEIRRLPSDECTTCEHFGVCYGGCPVLWKNYSFSALKEFKAKAHHSGVSGE